MYLDITLEEERKLESLVSNCDLTLEEAMQVIFDDREVDNTSDKEGNIGALSKEQEKAIKQYKNTTGKVSGKQTNRKANADKLHIMELLQDTFYKAGISYNVENEERLLTINYKNTEYKITLSKVTKKKEGK